MQISSIKRIFLPGLKRRNIKTDILHIYCKKNCDSQQNNYFCLTNPKLYDQISLLPDGNFAAYLQRFYGAAQVFASNFCYGKYYS